MIDKTVGDARTNQLNGRDTALAKPTQNEEVSCRYFMAAVPL